MIKVLNIISDTNIGGAGRVLLNYLKYRNSADYDIYVLVPTGSLLKAPLMELGAAVYEADGFADASFSMSAIKTIKRVIHEVSPHIVHTHGSLAGRIAGKQCRKKVIYTRHSVFPVSPKISKGPGRLANKLINEHYADTIIAVSPAAMENLTDGGISPKLINVVMNGVEPMKRLEGEALADAKKRFGVIDGVFTAGILARFEEYKGHKDILEAVKLLKDSGIKIRVIMAGTGTYEDAVKEHAEKLGLNDEILFAGFVSDVNALLSVLDVQLNASWGTEATSLSLLEGMSMGLPALVSDYGGNPYVIHDGVNGFTFPTRDTAALAEKLKAMMDENEMQKLRNGSYSEYAERFTAEKFAKNIEDIYSGVMEV